MKKAALILEFRGEHAFLSNFFSCVIKLREGTFGTAEHAYQFFKTDDVGSQREIQCAATPGYAKRLGSKVPLRADWEDVKIKIMERVLLAKFSVPILRTRLLGTGKAKLVEGNWWHDNFWGSCLCEKCGNRGENTLGELLMSTRARIEQSARR